jgi:hypothetical protein
MGLTQNDDLIGYHGNMSFEQEHQDDLIEMSKN